MRITINPTKDAVEYSNVSRIVFWKNKLRIFRIDIDDPSVLHVSSANVEDAEFEIIDTSLIKVVRHGRE